jgi:AcrR family transcriptional regulator
MLGEPARNRRAERREATKAEILDASWALARAHGLAGLSLRDVARRVGMQPPSLYEYFDSKHAIYDAMYAQGAMEWVERYAELGLTGEPLADLKRIGRFFMEFCTADPARYQLLFQRTIPGFEPTPESFEISEKSLQDMQQHFAAIGMTEQWAIDLFTALGTGLTDQQISNDPGGDRWLRLVDDAVEMFFNHLEHKKRTPRTSRTKRKAKGS